MKLNIATNKGYREATTTLPDFWSPAPRTVDEVVWMLRVRAHDLDNSQEFTERLKLLFDVPTHWVSREDRRRQQHNRKALKTHLGLTTGHDAYWDNQHNYVVFHTTTREIENRWSLQDFVELLNNDSMWQIKG